MSSDHGNPDGGGTGDIGSDEYSHYKAVLAHRFTFLATLRCHVHMAESETEGYIPVIAKSIAPISNSRDCAKEPMQSLSTSSGKELSC